MRQLNRSWIEVYHDFITPLSDSPPEFHTWCAISAVGATLKRHVWVDRGSYKLYPNLYVLLVGRPATGKGNATWSIIELLEEANVINLLSHRLTIEWVLKTMAEGFSAMNVAQSGAITVGLDHSALLFEPELSSFLRRSTDYLSDLTEIWDSRDKFDYGTKQQGLKRVDKPCLSMLAAAQPRTLASSIPADAIGGGLTRRINFIYTRRDPVLPKWTISKNGSHGTTRALLIDDLRHIANLTGTFKATAAFISAFDTYTGGIQFTCFEDEVTEAYKASKYANALKIAMIHNVARTDDLLLDEQDFAFATRLVDAVERDLPIVFQSVGESTETQAGAKILEFINARGYASYKEVLKKCWKAAPRDDIIRILATFVEAGLIDEVVVQRQVVYKSKVTIP